MYFYNSPFDPRRYGVDIPFDKRIVGGDMCCLVSEIEKERDCSDDDDYREDDKAELFVLIVVLVYFRLSLFLPMKGLLSGI